MFSIIYTDTVLTSRKPSKKSHFKGYTMAYSSRTIANSLHHICQTDMPPSNCWLLPRSVKRLPVVRNVRTPNGIIPKTSFRRAVYLLHVGPIEPGNIVWSRCTESMCVKPSHLKQGTREQFQADQRMHRLGYAFV